MITANSPTVRTASVARAERAARRENSRPLSARVTDEAVDALIGEYDKAAEYPCLTARNLQRREQRDGEKRDIHTGEQRSDGATIFTDGPAFSTPAGNTNDSTFNRVAPHASVTDGVVDASVTEDIGRILAALDLPRDTRRMLWLRMEGYSLSEIGEEYGLSKQAVDRRLAAVGNKLFLFWLSDDTCGYESVIRTEANKAIVRRLAGGRPGAPATVCDCGSQQHRAQRVVGQPGVYTYHCCNCKVKRTRAEWEALTGQGMKAAA